jgi:hypothetical protein
MAFHFSWEPTGDEVRTAPYHADARARDAMARAIEGRWLLTQEEFDCLAPGTHVLILWAGGNGPHRYRLTRHAWGHLTTCYTVPNGDRDTQEFCHGEEIARVGRNRTQHLVACCDP